MFSSDRKKRPMAENDLKVLVIAYYFPPSNLVGAFRVQKFVKFLSREASVSIDVVSVDENLYRQKGASRFAESEKLKIHRTGVFRGKLPVREEGIYWLPKLIPFLAALTRKKKFDVLYITGNPFFSFLAAPIIKRLRAIPYILDFRDPWSLSPYRKKTHLNKALFGLIRLIEKSAVKNASYVLNVTDDATAMYKEEYKNLDPSKFLTIENGVDTEDLTAPEIKSPYGFTMVYVGKFSDFRDPEPLMGALGAFVKKRGLVPDDFRFVHVGGFEPKVAKAAREAGIEEYFENTGYLDYPEVIGRIKGSDLCVLVSGGHPYEPTTKVFDYMALGKGILAICPEKGFLADALTEYGGGKMVPQGKEEIGGALEYFYDARTEQKSAPILPEKFRRDIQAQKLLALFRKCANKRAPERRK